MKNKYDAIIIGSGISGGWAAKELTEKGLKVLMLDRSKPYEHIKDYQASNKPFFDYPFKAFVPTKELNKDHPSSTDYNSERIPEHFINETENPIEQTKPFNWVRANVWGGRSTLWSRVSLRLSDLDFEANDKDGIAIDWPVRYKDIAPWYDYVESYIGVTGTNENLPQLPDGKFQKPFGFNIVEEHLRERLNKKTKGKCHLIHPRVAHITEHQNGRISCQNRDMCINGCPFGSYFSTQSTTLPAAVATGNLTVRPFSLVQEIIYNKDTKKATGVKVIDTETLEELNFTAKIIFLCASTIASTQILQNSALDVWPKGLGSSSDELGHNLMDHHDGLMSMGKIDGFLDKKTRGYKPAGHYIPRFVNLDGNDKKNYIRGFGFQGKVIRTNYFSALGTQALHLTNTKEASPLKILTKLDPEFFQIGKGFPDQFKKLHHWQIGNTAFGEILPYHDNKTTLNYAKKDKYGLPLVQIDAELKANEIEMRKDMIKQSQYLLDEMGATDTSVIDIDYTFGGGIHEMGSARMGHSPKTSVLNKHNQVWDCKNVFVTDGSFMVSAACQNPSLTYMAFTARAADFAVQELKKGNL